MMEFWVSSKRGTCWVQTKNDVIVDTASLWRKFIGQDFDALLRWLKDAKVEEICSGKNKKSVR